LATVMELKTIPDIFLVKLREKSQVCSAL